MYNHLLADQVPSFWETIKFAVAKVYAIEEKDAPVIFNDILQSMLSDKYQVFIKRSDDGKKTLQSILITEINIHKITGFKTLRIECLYSFKYSDIKGWEDFFNFLLDFAKSQHCERIIYESNVARIWEIAEQLGFFESFRTFTYKVEGGA